MHYRIALFLFFTSNFSYSNDFEKPSWDQLTNIEFEDTNSKVKILNSTQNFSKFTNLLKCSTFEINEIEIRNRFAIIKSNCGEKENKTALLTGFHYQTLVATKDIAENTEITNRNAAFAYVTTKRKHEKPDLSSRVMTRKSIKKGEPISKRTTKRAPDIFKGEIILVKESGKNFAIFKKITALESGNIGDTIDIFDNHEKRGTIILENNTTSVKISK